MKSSTLHRSSLSIEKMSMIENVKPQSISAVTPEFGEYTKFQKKPELDVLWRDFEKSVQSKSRTKAPAFYIAVGFVFGLLSALAIALIIGFAALPGIQNAEKSTDGIDPKTPVSIVPSEETKEGMENVTSGGLEEKYTVKSGDTLDKIAYRFYGKYDPDKIEKIMKLNNIKNETTIQIGQVLIIPLD